VAQTGTTKWDLRAPLLSAGDAQVQAATLEALCAAAAASPVSRAAVGAAHVALRVVALAEGAGDEVPAAAVRLSSAGPPGG